MQATQSITGLNAMSATASDGDPVTSDRFIREKERARLTGVPRASWWRAEKRDEVPKSYPLVGDTRGWLLSEIHEWMRQRTAA